jgi:hypothetical protein
LFCTTTLSINPNAIVVGRHSRIRVDKHSMKVWKPKPLTLDKPEVDSLHRLCYLSTVDSGLLPTDRGIFSH